MGQPVKSGDSDLTYKCLKGVSYKLLKFVGKTKILDDSKKHDLLDLSDFAYNLREELVSAMKESSEVLENVARDIEAYKTIDDINKILRRYAADWYKN